jgi:cell division protein FtsB
MNAGLKRTLAVASLTFGVATIGLHSVHLPQDSFTDSGRQAELQHQYDQVQKEQERERRRVMRLRNDAEISEHLRSAELRPAERKLARLTARKEALAVEKKALAAGGDDAARAAARKLLVRKP